MRPIQKDNNSAPRKKPFVFFIRFIGVIFITEFIVMLLLKYFNVEESVLEFLGDSILLSIVSAPFLYFLVIRVFLKSLGAESEKAHAARESEIKAKAYGEKMALKAYADNIVQSVPTGLLSVSSDLKILSANPSFCRMFSLAADPVGNFFYEIPLFQKCKDMVLAALGEQSLKSEKVLKHEVDGEIKYFRVNVTHVIQDQSIQSNALLVFEDITRRRTTERKVFEMAYHDSLTGLPNRRLFNNRLRQVIATMKRDKLMAALLFLDVDRFKFINDTLGHEIGDDFLKEMSKRLEGSIRPGDTIARFGGDEFVVLLGGINREKDALKVVKRIFSAFETSVSLLGHDLRLSVSIGVSLYPNSGETPETLLKTADTAMYEAKLAGGNSCRFFESEMSLIGAEWIKMEHKLHKAIGNEELVLHYQPQVNIKSGELVGVEALIRWQDPEGGLIGPAKFIPMAEETGLIIPIGEWLIKRACAQAKAWQDKGLKNIRVSVNISMLQFRRSGFLSLVTDVLKETGLAPSNLELELTESIIMKDAEETINKLVVLKNLGVRLAIDDFGTGYSSLSYLKLMPIDVLKIDQSFVRDITKDDGNEAIVKAIIRLGRSLNIETLAEGVETEEQLSVLKGYYCSSFQGYLVSRPAPAKEIEKFLHASWSHGENKAAAKA